MVTLVLDDSVDARLGLFFAMAANDLYPALTFNCLEHPENLAWRKSRHESNAANARVAGEGFFVGGVCQREKDRELLYGSDFRVPDDFAGEFE